LLANLGDRMAAVLRSARERAIQTLCFEGIGLAIVAPLYGWLSGAGIAESLLLIAALSLVVMAWAALFNTLFDWAEWQLVHCVASSRPHRWRLVHAVALEVSAVLVSCPVIVLLTGLSWWDALLLDMALTLVYVGYGYVFHLAFDRLRPVST
jgi:uncharacterized membrane protein